MIVNKQSWHYRRFEEYFNNLNHYKRYRKFNMEYRDAAERNIDGVHTSLCQYFWVIMWFYPWQRFGGFMGRNIDAVLAVFFGVVMLSVFTVVTVQQGIWFAVALFGTVIGGVAVTFGVVLLIIAISDSKDTIRDNIVYQYMSARKRKVCPLIEFEE